jgi:hypothetical protein
MPTHGPTTGTFVSVADINTDWTNLGNGASSNDSYVTCALAAGASSNKLLLHELGLAVPTDETPIGFTADVELSATAAASIFDVVVSFTPDAGVSAGDNLANANAWPASDTTRTYGSQYTTSGLGDLEAADVNSDDFGLFITVVNTDGSARTAQVDTATITVHTANGQYSVTVYPTQAENLTRAGASVSWGTPTGALVAGDFNDANSGPGAGQTTDWLRVYDFEAGLPAGAVVHEYLLQAMRADSALDTIDSGLYQHDGMSEQGDNAADLVTVWPSSYTRTYYRIENVLATGVINSKDFGFVLSVEGQVSGSTPSVDALGPARIFYDLSAANSAFHDLMQ